MLASPGDPTEIAFWKRRLLDGSLLESVKAEADRAKRVFGEAAVHRGELPELGMILGAWEILMAAPGTVAFGTDPEVEERLASLLDGLPAEAQVVARDFLSPQQHEKLVKEVAKRILARAAGGLPASPSI